MQGAAGLQETAIVFAKIGGLGTGEAEGFPTAKVLCSPRNALSRDGVRMIDYTGLNQKHKEQKISRTDLRSLIGLSPRTIAKIGKLEALSGNTLRRIADYLGCDSAQLCREGSDNPILQTLRAEKEGGISGGLYHALQVRMAYHSNHMEGSRLTEEQTRLIFETNTVPAGDGVPADDILETVHHFRAIDFMQGRKACGAQGMPSPQDLFPFSSRTAKRQHIFAALQTGTRKRGC